MCLELAFFTGFECLLKCGVFVNGCTGAREELVCVCMKL